MKLAIQDKLSKLPKFNDKKEKENFLKLNYPIFYQCYETALVTASLLELNWYSEEEFIFPKISYLEDNILCVTSETCCFILEEEKTTISSVSNKDFRNFVEVDNNTALKVISNIIVEDFSVLLSKKDKKLNHLSRYLYRDQHNRLVSVIDGAAFISIDGSSWMKAEDESFYWSSVRNSYNIVHVLNSTYPASFSNYTSTNSKKSIKKRKNWQSWLENKKYNTIK